MTISTFDGCVASGEAAAALVAKHLSREQRSGQQVGQQVAPLQQQASASHQVKAKAKAKQQQEAEDGKVTAGSGSAGATRTARRQRQRQLRKRELHQVLAN
jgi:hypothetical protein